MVAPLRASTCRQNVGSQSIFNFLGTPKCPGQPMNRTRTMLRLPSLTRGCTSRSSHDSPSCFTPSTRSMTPCHIRPSDRPRITTTYRRLPIASKQRFSTSPRRPFLFGLFGDKSDNSSNNETQKVYTTPYRPKREWPPDVTQLSQTERFRLERKYRRRAKLKSARPTWDKWTKIVQWGLIGFVVIYAVLAMEMKDSGTNPFLGIRKYLREQMNASSIWTTPDRRSSKEAVSTTDESSSSRY